MAKKILVFVSLFFIAGCSWINNFIPIEVDKLIGEQFAAQMSYNPMQGKVLDSVSNKEVYQYLHKIKKNLLKSDQIKYKNDFVWKLHVIDNDSVLNAFCVAGGYIYVYTGIIKFLDSEAELAGVLAHEIAHADCRHTTMRMATQYGVSLMIGLMTGGDVSFLVEIARELLGLTFSRADEKEADEHAVAYMYSTPYDPRAVGGFFKKLVDKQKDSYIPEFLSTHPASENRVTDIEAKWKQLGAKEGKYFKEEHQKIVALLSKNNADF